MNNIIKILLLVFSANVFAQVAPPQAFSYSGVARDAQNLPIANQTIGIQFSIVKTSPTGTAVYQENHFTNTDQSGLFTLEVGTGSVQQGVFANINWGSDNFYLKVGLDASGNTNFQVVGTTQLLSVPYALYAKSAGTTANSTDNDTSATNEIQTLSLNGNTLSLSNGGGNVTLPSSGGNINPSYNVKQQIPVYGLFFNPHRIFSTTATTDGNILFVAIQVYNNLDQSYLVRLERDGVGIYHPTNFSSLLTDRVRSMTIIDTFVYIHFDNLTTPIKRTGISGNMNFTNMTFNPSIPSFIGDLFTDGTNLFITNFSGSDYQIYQIISTALINSNNNFSFSHNGSTTGFAKVIFDGTHYITTRANNPNYYLLKYDLNRNLIVQKQISSAAYSDYNQAANCSSSKLILANIAVGSGYAVGASTPSPMPVIITSPIDKP